MKHLSLREKLVLYFLSLGLGAIILTSAYSFYSSRNALLTRTFDQLSSLRQAKQSQVERFFQDRFKDITLLSHSDEMQEIIRTINQAEQSGRVITGSDLKKFSVFRNNFDCLYFLGKNERFLRICPGDSGIQQGLTSALPEGILSFLPSVNQGMMLHDVLIDKETGHPAMYISAPVTGPNRRATGTVIMEIRLQTINEIMLSKIPNPGFGRTGETYLVGSDKLMRSSSRFIPNSVLRTAVRTEPVKNAFSGTDDHMISTDYRGIPVLSSYSKISIPNVQWAILAEIERQEAMIPVIKIRNNLFLLSSLVSLLFIGAVIVIAGKITRPIVRLKYAAMKIGTGEYNVSLPVTTRDEIGSLTSAFNLMSSQIKEKTEDLKNEKVLRLRTVIDAEEAERLRLSREIHDGIGQSLIAHKLKLESLLYLEDKQIKDQIRPLKEQFDVTVDEIRRISNNLMPSVLQVFGISVALGNLCRETEEHAGIRIRYVVKGDPEAIHAKIKTYLYRIAQEALNNVVKHSGATEAELSLTTEDDIISFIISDNGIGFSRNKNSGEKGNGLHNMRERVSLLHGSIIIRPTPGKGTQINIKIPVF